MLHVVLCGYTTWSLTAGLWEDHRLRMLENGVRRDVLFGLRERKQMESGENCVMNTCITVPTY